MTTLTNQYGYNSEGETFTICDPNEAWIMEMMGKGPGSKGTVWVAIRIPDNAVCGHANQSRIGKFNMKDKKNVLYSKDVVEFARKKVGTLVKMQTSHGRKLMQNLISLDVGFVMREFGASSITFKICPSICHGR